MDPNLYSTSNGEVIPSSALEILEQDEEGDQPKEIYILPPDEKSAETEEDSDNSDEETANPNHISRGILNQQCEVHYEDSDFDEEDDNICLSIIKRSITEAKNTSLNAVPSTSGISNRPTDVHLPPSKRPKNSSKWSQNMPTCSFNKDCTPRQTSASSYLAQTPLDFFNLFWDENIINKIVTQSNLYAQQRNINLNMTQEELIYTPGKLQKKVNLGEVVILCYYF